MEGGRGVEGRGRRGKEREKWGVRGSSGGKGRSGE